MIGKGRQLQLSQHAFPFPQALGQIARLRFEQHLEGQDDCITAEQQDSVFRDVVVVVVVALTRRLRRVLQLVVLQQLAQVCIVLVGRGVLGKPGKRGLWLLRMTMRNWLRPLRLSLVSRLKFLFPMPQSLLGPIKVKMVL